MTNNQQDDTMRAFDYLKLCIGDVLRGKPRKDLDEAIIRMQRALASREQLNPMDHPITNIIQYGQCLQSDAPGKIVLSPPQEINQSFTFGPWERNDCEDCGLVKPCGCGKPPGDKEK